MKVLFSQRKLSVTSVCFPLFSTNRIQCLSKIICWTYEKSFWNPMDYHVMLISLSCLYSTQLWLSCLQNGNLPKPNSYLSDLTCIYDLCYQRTRTYCMLGVTVAVSSSKGYNWEKMIVVILGRGNTVKLTSLVSLSKGK